MRAKGDAAGVNMSFDLMFHSFFEMQQEKNNLNKTRICKFAKWTVLPSPIRTEERESRSEVEGGSVSRGSSHKHSVGLERLVPEWGVGGAGTKHTKCKHNALPPLLKSHPAWMFGIAGFPVFSARVGVGLRSHWCSSWSWGVPEWKPGDLGWVEFCFCLWKGNYPRLSEKYRLCWIPWK